MKHILIGDKYSSYAGTIIGFFFLISTQYCAHSSPDITWAPARISETISPLEEKSLNVSFTSSKEISDVVVSIVPELQPYIKAEPSAFSSISAGVPRSLTLKLSAPASAMLDIIEGEIRLTSTSSLGSSLAKSLPVVLQIGKKFTYGNFSVLYPTFGKPSEEHVRTDGDNTVVDIKIASLSGGEAVSQFGFILYQNPSKLDLMDWFRQNVDLSGELSSGGAFSMQPLSNGMSVLVPTGVVPDNHLDPYGPIADFYAISPGRDVIVILSMSQVNELDTYGYASDSQRSLLLAILQSMKF
jgi:hypothetical protein